MPDEIIICGTAPREGMPDANTPPERCPECGCAEFGHGFGLAGGGYGPYLACERCSYVVAKTQIDDEVT